MTQITMRTAAVMVTWCAAHAALAGEPAAPPARPSPGEVLAAAPASAWREPVAESTVVMELPNGSVVVELAPAFAPKHAESIRRLVRAGYFDGLAVIRAHDNYVIQWGDPEEDEAKQRKKPLDPATAAPWKVPAEFDRPLAGLTLSVMPDLDPWAPRTGFVDGFPVAADPKSGRAWLTHCYGMVGAGRGNEVDSSDGSSLYAVIGQPARGLDLNITTVGRVLAGIELLAGLPRGSGALGFYDKPEQRVPIRRARVLADLPAAERPRLQVLRTDTATWDAWLDARRHRSGWFVKSHGRIDLCSALPPVRPTP